MGIHEQIDAAMTDIQKDIYKEYLKFKISDLSEETWFCEWYSGIEYHVWQALWSGDGQVVLNFMERHKLIHVALICNAWPIEEDSGVVFVTLTEWGALYNKWAERMKVL